MSSHSCGRQKSEASSIRQARPPRHLFEICAICGEKLEKRHTRGQTQQNYKNITPRSPCETNQCETSSRCAKRRQIHFPIDIMSKSDTLLRFKKAHQERQIEQAAASHRWEAERLLQTDTARVATQTSSHMDANLHRFESNVAAELDEWQRINIHEFSVKSAQALEAQREVLTHEAAEESHRRDVLSLGVMQTLEFGLHSEASAQRERFEQTRYDLQKCLNSSNEECRKYHNLADRSEGFPTFFSCFSFFHFFHFFIFRKKQFFHFFLSYFSVFQFLHFFSFFVSFFLLFFSSFFPFFLTGAPPGPSLTHRFFFQKSLFLRHDSW